MTNTVTRDSRSPMLMALSDQLEIDGHLDVNARLQEVSDLLETIDVTQHFDAYLIAMLRYPHSYARRIKSYPKVFRRVYAELLNRDRNVFLDLNGLPLHWYIGTDKMFTYSARAECRRDVVELLRKNIRIERVTIREMESDMYIPDVTVEFRSPLRIETIRAVLDTIDDTHVFAETLRRGHLKNNPLTRVDYEA